MKTTSSPALTLGAWSRHDPIQRALNRVQPESVLEFGVGRGAMSARIACGRHFIGVEPDEVSRFEAQAIVGDGGKIVGSTEEIDGADPVDLVCAFEVLEHIEHEQQILTEWAAYLEPNGYLLLSVPAFAHRLGAWDRLVGHYRRYDPEVLSALLNEAGFKVVSLEITGFPLGLVLEQARNVVAWTRQRSESRQTVEAELDMAARTAKSARMIPIRRAGVATRFVSAPFRLAQQKVQSRGTGMVVLARRDDTSGDVVDNK